MTPDRTLLERLRKTNWNFKTPFTHGLRNFWAKNLESNLKFIKTGLNNMLSYLSKSAFKMASEDPQKNIATTVSHITTVSFFCQLSLLFPLRYLKTAINWCNLVLNLSLLFSKVCCYNFLYQAGLPSINVWLITCYANLTSTYHPY